MNQKLKHMTYKIFLCEDRVPFLVDKMEEGKVKVGETYNNGITALEVTIDDASDLVSFFHAGLEVGEADVRKTTQAK